MAAGAAADAARTGAAGDVDALLAELLAKPDTAESETDALLEELLDKASKDAKGSGSTPGSGSALDELLAKAAATAEAAEAAEAAIGAASTDSDASEILAELLGEKAGAKSEKTAAEALVDELLKKHAGATGPDLPATDAATAATASAGAAAAAADASDPSDVKPAARATKKRAAAKTSGKSGDSENTDEPIAATKELEASADAASKLSGAEPKKPIVDADEEAVLGGVDEADEADEAGLPLVAVDEAAHSLQKPAFESDGTDAEPGMVAQGVSEPAVLPQRRHVWPLLITALIIFIMATGGLTYFNRTVIAGQAELRAEIQQQGDALLNESIALIQNADSVIVALSVAVDSQITETDIPRLEALLDQMDSTQASLDLAITKAKEAEQVYLDKDRKALAGYAQTAAELRKQMLGLSSQLTSYDIAALRCALAVDYSWMLIVDAASEMHAAGEAMSAGKASAVPESRDYNQSALEKLTLAEEALVKAEEHFPDVNLKPLMDYVVVKKASAQLALESDLAFLDGDYTATRTKNAEFIAKDAEAVQLALALPENPMSLVQQAYSDVTKQLRDDYVNVRDQAVENDAYLRDYLGVNTTLEPVPDAEVPGAAPDAGADGGAAPDAGTAGGATPGAGGLGGAGDAGGSGDGRVGAG